MDQGLIKDYCDDFIAKLNDPATAKYIGDEYFPIIWFGNEADYRASKIKVITVALNPSKGEFTDARFPAQAQIRADLNAGKIPPTDLESDLNNYFNNNPYKPWFNNYDQLALMKAFGVNYAKGVLHIDLMSAIPTSTLWGDLSSSEKNKFKRTDLALRLINDLNPDVMLVSCKESEFKAVFSGAIQIKDYSLTSHKKLKLYDWQGIKVLFGTNFVGQPFRTVKPLITPDVIDAATPDKFKTAKQVII